MTTQHPTTPKAPKDSKNTTAAAGAGAHTPTNWFPIAESVADQLLKTQCKLTETAEKLRWAESRMNALDIQLAETAAERDRPREALGTSQFALNLAIAQRDQAREQVKTLLATCEACRSYLVGLGDAKPSLQKVLVLLHDAAAIAAVESEK